MLPSRISTDNAKPEKLFYFVANVVVYRAKDARVLILKRAETEKVFPGLWGMIGGKLEHQDFDITHPDRTLNDEVANFHRPIEKLLQREVLEEAGIQIKDKMTYLKSLMFVRPDEIPVMFAVFIAEYKSGKVRPEKGAFSDYAWVNDKEILDYQCIEGIEEEITEAIKLCRQNA
ncbi:MAG: NUDIX domain-containing protein [Candidatus Berkelbacteria bacterium]|nr:MAG: NUDIX domain-containing protein [Candidatus Berkelbacteria bacterium]QQG51947.1 MAG: NUDIX domain-containing protein [Candidatus Berkelbacteria bacterium]